jgi:hypothetical protein
MNANEDEEFYELDEPEQKNWLVAFEETLHDLLYKDSETYIRWKARYDERRKGPSRR